MGPLLKLLLVALLTLPAGAFVVGRLSAEPVDPVPPRAPVVLDDAVPAEPPQTIESSPDADDGPDRSRGPGSVEVIGPGPTELDDDDEREDEADERDETGEDRDDARDDRAEDDADDRVPGDRDDDETEADEPEHEGPEDGEELDESDEAEDAEERDEEDDEADDD